ncbi:ATP-binding protein [Actinoplanes sp. DH11]|uniref:ATP-binding protein n=1 Tax=Actinoplanes sp. DH11 TaxID=2857011 RepID=UPI001E2F9E7E|nr:ATP-binding protein [Actinoplanes sp. DH11]
MGVRSPFLFDAEPAPVTVRSEFDAQLTVVVVRGPWTGETWQRTARTLRKCFAEHPAGLVLDLSGLEDDAARSVPTWLHAYRTGAAMEPPVRVAVCAPAGPGLGGRLARLNRSLPICSSLGQAREALGTGRSLTDRVTATLAADPRSPGEARRLVAGACAAWDLPGLVEPARLLVSELVSNVVEHVGSESRLLVARRGRGLHVAVADGSRTMPRPTGRAPRRALPQLTEGGRGLNLVHDLAAAWGAMPIDGGKMVWAVLRPAGDR